MKKTRILSLLLALCMVFSLFSVPVLASDSSASVSVQSSEDEDEKEKEKEKKEEEEKKKKEEEKKKKEEEEKKKKEEEEKKKKEEEEKKKKEEEEKKKQEEEEKKKKEEEEKKKAEEEKKEEEKKSDSSDKSDSSGDKSDKSDKSDSSGDKSDKSDKSDSSGDKSDKSDSSDGDKSKDPGDKSDSSGGTSSSSGSKGEDSSADASKDKEKLSSQEESQETEPEEKPEEKEEKEEKEEEDEKEKEKKKLSKKVHAKLVNDVSGAQTLTAADFSDYKNDNDKAEGAKISFKRLVTLKVTDLVADDSSAGKKNISRIESVMTWINNKGHKKYPNTMFKVVIPKGTYYIDGRYTKTTSRCIHLYSNTWLSMKGVTLIKSDTRNRAIIRAGKSSKSYSGYGGESNIIVEGGVIDGNTRIHKSKTQHYSGVRFGHDHDILIANVDFKGNVSGHHLELCGVKGISVVGCSFTDYKNTGYTKGINRNEAIQIDVTNSANLTPTYKSFDDTLSGNVVIYDNKFEDLSRGVGSHSAVFGKYYDDIVIENNTFKDIKSQAVHCENYRNCSISDNSIKNCGGGIDFNAICYAPDGNYYRPHGSLPKYSKIKSYNAKTVINGNKIAVKKGSSLKNASGIYVHGGKANSSRTKKEVKPYYKKTFRITGVTIKGNKITRARSSGVFLSYVGNYKISDNKVSNITSGSAARGMGMYLDNCSGGAIQGNKISKTNSHGVYFLSSEGSDKAPLTVYDNNIDVTENTGCIGVYLKDSKCAEVTKNTIEAKSYGVYLSKSSTVTVGERNASNTMTSSAKYGVYATGKSKSGIFVQYNWITSKQEATHAASGSRITASDNVVKVIS